MDAFIASVAQQLNLPAEQAADAFDGGFRRDDGD
jgi:hypothetical protein